MKRDTTQKKRRFAGILAVILVAAMLLSVIAPFIGSVYAAQPQAPVATGAILHEEDNQQKTGFSMDIQFGINQHYIAEKMAPVTILVSNYGERFKGEIQTKIYSYEESGWGAKQYSVVYQPLELEKDASKQVVLDIASNMVTKTLKVSLVEESGKEVYTKQVAVKPHDPSTIALGILTENKQAVSYLDSINIAQLPEEEYITGIDYNFTAFLDENSFFDEAVYLDMFQAIIINDFDTRKLSEKQVSALKQWTKNGGMLILATGNHAQKVLSGIGDAFGVYPSQNSGAFLPNDAFGESFLEILENRPIYSEKLEIEDAKEVQWDSKGEAFSWVKPLENGKVIIHSYDLDTCAPDIKSVLESFYLEQADWRFDVESPSQVTYRSYDSSLPLAGGMAILPLFLFLGFYLIVIGPILYLFLKKKNRKELAWVLIPVSSVLALFVVFMLGKVSDYNQNIVLITNQIDFDNSLGEANSQSLYSIRSPQKGDVVFEMPERTIITPIDNYFYNSYDTSGKEEVCLMKILSGQSTAVTYFGSEAWGGNQFSTQKQFSIGGGIQSQIIIEDNYFLGSLTNNTTQYFDEVVLSFGSQLERIGSMAPEETKEIYFELPQNTDLTNYDIYSSISQVFGTNSWRLTDETQSLEYKVKHGLISRVEAYRLNKYSDMLFGRMNETVPQMQNGIPICFYGFSQEPIFEGDMVVNGKKAKQLNYNLFYTPLSLSYENIEHFDIPYGVIYPESIVVKEENGMVLANGSNQRMDSHFYSGESGFVQIDFLLPQGLQPDRFQIAWLENDMQKMEKQIFNFETQQWEQLQQEEYQNDIKEYVSEDGIVRLQTQIYSDFSIHMPQISLKRGNTDAGNH